MGSIETYRNVTNRGSNYRQWSERATVVSYDATTQSYDIVVTAIGPTGEQVSNTNRSLRQVKSLFPPETLIHSPGDSILIGYVSEQREHPIILGLGDHVAPSSNTPVVTLPTSVNTSSITGPNNGGLGGLPFPPACAPRVSTGSTTTGQLVVDCTQLDAGRTYNNPAQVYCTGSSNVQWSWNHPGGTLVITGSHNSVAKLKFPVNTGATVAGTAYKSGRYHICNGGFNAMDVKSWGCNDQVLADCTKNLANSNKYNPTSCHYCGEGDPACGVGDTAETAIETNDPTYGTGSACLAARPCNHKGTFCDARTQAMKDQGCSPCGVSANSILTATVGASIVTVTVIVHGVND